MKKETTQQNDQNNGNNDFPVQATLLLVVLALSIVALALRAFGIL